MHDQNGRDNQPDSSQVIVHFSPNGAGCELTLHHVLDPRWAGLASQAEALWRKMLDLLDGVLS